MARRYRGSGSIRERADGRFEARVQINGKRYSFFGATFDEADEKLQDARRKARKGGVAVMPGRLTVGQYFEDWHASRLYSAQSTRSQYGGIIRNHIVPTLGPVRLTGLTADHIRKLLRDKEREGKGDRLLQYIRQVLHAGLQDALIERKLDWNPAAAVAVREPQPKPRAVLDWSQQIELLEKVEGDRLYAAYVLMLSCALRPGEVFGLTWDDVDWARGLLTVRRVLAKAESGWDLRERTKTGRVSIMPLAEPVLEALREHHVRQLAEARQFAEIWDNRANLVFVDQTGRYIDPDRFRKEFKKLAPAGVVPYSLRHSAATFALADGDDYKTVQGLLRHSRASVTMNVYAHAVDRVQRESADRRAQRLFAK